MKFCQIFIFLFFFISLSFADNPDFFKNRLLKDAEKNVLSAQINAAELYYYGGGYGGSKNGIAVEQNYGESFKWYSKAAKQGNIDAKYKIALMYYEGNGVKQDRQKAIKMIKDIEKNSDEKAIEILDKMIEEDLDNLSKKDQL